MNFKHITGSKRCATVVSHWWGQVLCALMAACLPVCLVFAGEVNDPFTPWPIVADQELAKLRGGFITADGLNINIGLEQLVMIDGTVKTHYNLDLSGLGPTPNRSNPAAAEQNKLVQIVQNGEHNLVTPDVPANFGGGALTVIQNSLDTQLIQNFTVLHVDVSGISQIRTNALGRSIGMELVRSLH